MNKLVLLAVLLLGIGIGLFVASAKTFPVSQILAPTPAITVRPSLQASPSGELATVKRVIDGDTVELSDGRRVRYIGIDTPETVDPRKPVQCFGREAKAENQKLVEGKAVRLEKDVSETDKYKRLLRYVTVGDLLINDYLVRQGFAHVSTFPPDVKYTSQFKQAEAEARENNRGLWAGCAVGNNPTNPTNPTNLTNQTNEQENVAGITTASTITTCLIKGNISSSGEKIYHLPGCGSYDKTVIDESPGERWFCSEDEATKAGWRKAKNCP